jgi:hypothetical protein
MLSLLGPLLLLLPSLLLLPLLQRQFWLNTIQKVRLRHGDNPQVLL